MAAVGLAVTNDFLPDRDPIDWSPDDSPLDVLGVYLGEGAQALEVVVARASSRPRKADLTDLWSARRGRRANPVLFQAPHCRPSKGY